MIRVIYNRRDWAENIDPFMGIRRQMSIVHLSNPNAEPDRQDYGIELLGPRQFAMRHRCSCCGAATRDSSLAESVTYCGEKTWLCTRCLSMLTMPEPEVSASINAYKNQRLCAPKGSAAPKQALAASTPPAEAWIPGPARKEYHAPPRKLFSRRCMTRARGANLPRTARGTSNASDDAFSLDANATSPPANESDETPLSASSGTSQPTSESGPKPEDERDAATAATGNCDAHTGEGAVAEVTPRAPPCVECLTRSGLRAESNRCVQFANVETDMIAVKGFKPYFRESDALPWITPHDADVSDRARSMLCSEIIAASEAARPSFSLPCLSTSFNLRQAAPSRKGATTGESRSDAPTPAAGGFAAGFHRMSRTKTTFGLAAVALGLVAWSIRRRL